MEGGRGGWRGRGRTRCCPKLLHKLGPSQVAVCPFSFVSEERVSLCGDTPVSSVKDPKIQKMLILSLFVKLFILFYFGRTFQALSSPEGFQNSNISW